MNTFEKLFSTSPKDIKKDVIITPFLNLEYFRQHKESKINRGFLFEVLGETRFSVVKTGVGASFVGDAIVYLTDTPCKRVYFMGSCAAIRNFEVADLVIADKALARESFSAILLNKNTHFFITPKKWLFKSFLSQNKKVKKGIVATLGSLSLQDKLIDSLKQQNIDCVDMETSAFFSAANYFDLSSLALLYVTDIIGERSFFRKLNRHEADIIKASRQRAISLLCKFIENQSA